MFRLWKKSLHKRSGISQIRIRMTTEHIETVNQQINKLNKKHKEVTDLKCKPSKVWFWICVLNGSQRGTQLVHKNAFDIRSRHFSQQPNDREKMSIQSSNVKF